MKTITSLMFAAALILGLAGTKVCTAQVTAIGHISAEVIESVSASSNAVTSFAIATAKNLGASSQSASVASNLNLGTMTVNSGSNSTVNVVLKSANLTDSQGNGFTLDPSLNNNAFASVSQSNGTQRIQLNGTANLGTDQTSGLYQGSYTVVFAYN